MGSEEGVDSISKQLVIEMDNDAVGKVLGSAACVSEIFRQLGNVVDLARSALVCKLWRSVATDDSLWAQLRQQLFGDVKALEKCASAKSWFATRCYLRSGALSTRTQDRMLELVANVSENGDIGLDSATQKLVLLRRSTPAEKPQLVLLDLATLQQTEEVELQGRLPLGTALMECNGEGRACVTLMDGIAVVDLAKRVQIGILQGHTSPIISLKTQGPLLLSSCAKHVCIWSLSTLSLLSQHPIQLNLPFTRLDTYTRDLSDISPSLGLAAFCAVNKGMPNVGRPNARGILPLPVAHIVETSLNGQVIHRLQLVAVLGLCFHHQQLLVLSLLNSKRASSDQVSSGGTATVTLYNTTTWESSKLISPWLEGITSLKSCFQVSYGFATFVHKKDAQSLQVWGFDLASNGKGRTPSKSEVEGGVMCVADSDRLPLVRLWQHENGQASGVEELLSLFVLPGEVMVKLQNGMVQRLELAGPGCPGVMTRPLGEGAPRSSYLRHGAWLV